MRFSLRSGSLTSDPIVERRSDADAAHAVRQAGYLFLGIGLIGVINDVVPGLVGHDHRVSFFLDTANLLIGVAALLLRDNHHFHGNASLILPILAMTSVSLNNAFGVLPEVNYGTYFMLIFVWVGIWYPPWTVTALSPLAAAAYLLPFLAGANRANGAVVAVFLAIPAAVVTGETISHYTSQARDGAIRREKLLSDLSRLVMTDELTGVGNRRLGELLLESLVAGDAVAVLDVDLFKEVNDTFGHPEGDRLLHQLGGFLNSSARDRDAVARMGGEEFLLVVRGAGLESEAIVSRLLQSWRARSPLATFSAGVAVHRARTKPSATYAAADRALYNAKEHGRDQVVMAVSGK